MLQFRGDAATLSAKSRLGDSIPVFSFGWLRRSKTAKAEFRRELGDFERDPLGRDPWVDTSFVIRLRYDSAAATNAALRTA
jgi:hypothetical protein